MSEIEFHPATKRLTGFEKSSYLPIQAVAELLEVDTLTLQDFLSKRRKTHPVYHVIEMEMMEIIPISTLKRIIETFDSPTAKRVRNDILSIKNADRIRSERWK